ncbi:Mg2+ and Co2+ transporter [Agarivorans sp. QJM3NY_29]|uniref:Mg2+ and Co2+ transporter n=2 Tax=Agarivorans TaxID=261825 RepID=UPI003D7EDD2E
MNPRPTREHRMVIHPTTFHYQHYPTVYGLLESLAFMWFVVLVTLGIAIWLIAKLWHIHSIPKHLAQEQGLAQAKLIFWLCILGLFYKPLWILAVLAIVTDWENYNSGLKERSHERNHVALYIDRMVTIQI